MSFISGTVSGVLGASAQNKATKTNMQIARETNEANLRMFQESRGAGGSSILPTYLEPGTEKVIANRAAAAAQAMFPDNPEMQLAQYQAILEQMRPTIQAGTAQLEGIYNGNLEAERSAALAPVLAARMGMADANIDAINMAGQDAINRLSAQDALKGYQGTGSFAQNRILDGLMQARQQAAMQKAGSVLQNELDKKQLSDAMSQLRLSSVDAPINRLGQLTKADQAPQMALGDLSQAATRPMEFFRISPQAFQAQRPDPVSAVPGAAQLALQGVSQTGGQVLGAYLQSKGTLFGGKGWGASGVGGPASLPSVADSATGLFTGECSVAKLVMPESWEVFFFYKELLAPDWFRDLYNQNARVFSRWLKNKPAMQSLVRRVMLGRINHIFNR
jgi:hypothetical protein